MSRDAKSKGTLKLIATLAVALLVIGSYILIVGDHFMRNKAAQDVVQATIIESYDAANNSSNDSIIMMQMNGNKNLIYSPPQKPAYILRLDDVQSPVWGNISLKIINDAISRNMSICIGVIPDRNEHNTPIFQYIIYNRNNTHLEIAQHGYQHTYYEYDNLSADIAQQKTMYGLRELYHNYGICPTTFIPPNNEINSQNNTTVNMLSDMGFMVVSSIGDVRYEGNMLNIGHTIATTDNTGGSLNTPDKIISVCERDFKTQNLSVIMIHPQDYVTPDKKSLDPVKYNTYLELLDKLNATGAQSITFRDLLVENNTTAI